MNEPDYEPDTRVTPERLAASVIVAGLVICTLANFGYILAMRASVLFMVPLTMIWLPDILIRVATLERWAKINSRDAL